MSEAGSGGLPPFAAPYLADFQQLARMLERVPGFILQPIEAPTPDLARAFADWLTRQGWQVRLRELPDARALLDLGAELVQQRSEPTGRELVLAVQSGELDGGAARASFAALNMARDSIARALPAPLLWWGSSGFMRATWSQAPDWWSVAATPFRLPIRSVHDLPSHLPLGTYWWTGAVHTASAKALYPRWTLLEGAADAAAAAADGGVSLDTLHTRIAAASTSGSGRSEAGLRLQLAERLESGSTPADALQEYVRARRLTAALGDLAATLAIDAHVVLDLAQFTDEPLRAELEQFAADAATRTEDPLSRALAALILAKLALMSNAFEASGSFSHEAIKQAQLADDPALETAAHGLLAAACCLLGDYTACLASATTALQGAIAADNRQMQRQARDFRVTALAELGDPRGAARELKALWGLLDRSADEDWTFCMLSGKIADLALKTGDSTAAAKLASFSVASHVVNGRLPARSWLAVDLDALMASEPETGRRLEAIFQLGELAATSDLHEHRPAQLNTAWKALTHEMGRLDEILAAAGVDAFDPDTWRDR